jgi:FlaA1/EpsC-like NDP-sugar epimerase
MQRGEAQHLVRKKIIDSLIELPIEVLSIPHFEELINGTASIDQLRDVPIEDLLGRESVSEKTVLLGANIRDKVVMVTGAGGSIGSELCRKILLQNPIVLILFEISEFALYQIEKELSEMVTSQQFNIELFTLSTTCAWHGKQNFSNFFSCN